MGTSKWVALLLVLLDMLGLFAGFWLWLSMRNMSYHYSIADYILAPDSLDVMWVALRLAMIAVPALVLAYILNRRVLCNVMLGIGTVLVAAALGLTGWQYTVYAEGNEDYILRYMAPAGDEQPMGEVLGEPVSYRFFAVRAKTYAVCGSDDAAGEAWADIISDVAEQKFAAEHGLVPEHDEVWSLNYQTYDDLAADAAGYAAAMSIVRQTGLTEDEFWYEWRPFFEVPMQLITERVYAYRQENGLPQPDYADVDAVILDREFFDSF